MRWTIPVLSLALACGAARAQPVLSADATVAERASFYERVARNESPAALTQLARKAAESPSGPMQRFQIEAVLDRYFELDPEGAVRLAGEMRRSGAADLVQMLYERLARADASAALSALSLVDDPTEERLAALAVLRGLGDDAKALGLVVATLHGVDVEQFRAEALQRLASKSPREALAGALALRDPARRNSVASVVVAQWGSRAPADALAEVGRVGDPALRATLRNVVLGSWTDVDSLAAYVDTLDAAAQREVLASGMLGRLIQADPARAAEIAAGMPAGDARRGVLMQIAASYAEKNPEAALAWAQGLGAEEPMLVSSVLGAAARRDPARAFDVAASLAEPVRSQAMVTVIGSGVGETRQFEALAGRIARLPEGSSKSQLFGMLVNSWASRTGNAAPALTWMLANASAVPPAAFEQVAYTFAQSDPAAAAGYVDRVPSAARGTWIGAVAIGYARGDPQTGIAFLERFRGDPAYDRAAVALAPQIAAFDPPAAARLLASTGPRAPDGYGAEIQVGRAWAARDPAAAAAWAIELPPLQRNITLSMVSTTWASSNPDALRSWALSLPQGEKRDAALSAAVRTRGTAPPDPEVLAAFSDDRVRQGALMTAIVNVAIADPPAARRLMETYITDPRMRTQAQQMIDTIPRGAMPTPAGGFFGVPVTVPSQAFVVPPGGVAVQPGVVGTIIGTAPGGAFVAPDGRLIGPRPGFTGVSPVDPVLRASPPPAPPPSNVRAPDRREEP
ncbi:MAG TPA: hypothetical protein VE907_06445 [Gammaproteobacteria bacterium]|nr:hypothetical protein [Gammaproteobacteria bacterium]